MFAGIVEGTGRVLKITKIKQGALLSIKAPFSLATTKNGDSIAVNGCCLTVVRKSKGSFETDLSDETLRVTNLGHLNAGDNVNLERPLRLTDRIGGHLVQGHVDGVGKIFRVKGYEIVIGFPPRLRRFMVPKGSIAVDGISMTIHRFIGNRFTLVVIPHTLRNTNLKAKRVGDPVNLEVDMIGKYIESLRKH